MKKIKVGIIGCGTIGSALAKKLVGEFSARAELIGLCDHHQEKAKALQKKLHRSLPIYNLTHIIQKSDLVIEAASAAVSGEIALKAIQKQKSALIMSVGGLLELQNHLRLLKDSYAKIWVPSGALSGIDGLLAAREAGIKSIKLITRKPPQGLKEAPYFSRHEFPRWRGNSEVCVFRGSVKEAVKGFPQNINVAAVLSLAAGGPEKISVEIWTSQKYKVNQHEVQIKSKTGQINTMSSSKPAKENPKTSASAIQAAVATLRKIFAVIQVGT